MLRPTILLPLSLTTGLTADQLAAILTHELAHIRRWDPLVNVFQRVVEAALFFHPMVWLVSRRIRQERENCCDDLVLAAGIDPIGYASSLLDVAERASAERRQALPALAALRADGRTSELGGRIRRLLGTEHHEAMRLNRPGVVLTIVAALLATAVLSRLAVNAEEETETEITAAVMSEDEQRAWRELEATAVSMHGELVNRRHLRQSLATMERFNFPESQRKDIRDQLERPIRSAELWQVPPEAWPLIARLKSLHELRITASDARGDALQHVASLPNLRRISVINSNVLPTDAANVLPTDATALKSATTLEHVEIMFTVFDEPAARRQELLGELTQAEQSWAEAYRPRHGRREHIIEATILTDRMLEAFRELPRLRTLRLVNTLVSGRGVEALAVHTELEELEVSIIDLTPEAARAIGRLTRLRKFGSADCSDETLTAFTGLTKLEELELWAQRVTDAGIRHLLPLKSLRKLALRGSSISDTGLLELTALPKLERLDLRHARGPLTPEGVAEFRRLKPQCRVLSEVGDKSDSQTASPEKTKQESADAGATAGRIRVWKVRLVDGENERPVEGIKVAVPRHIDSRPATLTSNADGLVGMPVPNGSAVGLKIESPGWWTAGFQFIGELRNDPPQRAADRQPARDPASIMTFKVWRGTTVRGRLLLPDGGPAAGVALNVGVYIHSQEWKERLGMDLGWQSWDHGQWPNWTVQVVTDAQAMFETTVPPPESRSWVRVGTTTLSFASIDPAGLTLDGPGKALASFAPFEREVGGDLLASLERDGRLDLGPLQLERGVTLRGRVLDAAGKGLEGVTLHTSGRHGPYAGRSTVSGEEGRFEFLPLQPGTFTITPDARLRDETANVASRDVQAVFVPQPFQLPNAEEPVETTVQAVPHVTLEFDWVDRRAEKGPVAYYGAFTVNGKVPTKDGLMEWWHGETERSTRDGRDILYIKVPSSIQDATLVLPADSLVTASYEDDQQTSGPGTVSLGDVTEPRRRVIYGDEPRDSEAHRPSP